MYDELIKSIHCCFGFDSMQTDCENCMMKDKREEHNYVGCCDALGLAAADAIEELSMKLHGDEAAIAGMKREIEHMVRAEKPRWVSVTERFPEHEYGESTSVLTVDLYGVMRVTYFDGGNWCWPSGEALTTMRVAPITHWMPLPEPPRER